MAVKMSVGTVGKAWLGSEDLPPRWSTPHPHGWQTDAGSWQEPLVPYLLYFSSGTLEGHIMWQLPSSRPADLRDSKTDATMSFMTLPWLSLSFPQCLTGYTDLTWSCATLPLSLPVGEWHRIQTPGSENRSGCAEGWLPGVDSLVIPSLQMREQKHRVIKQNAEGAILSGRAGSWMNTLSPACMLFRGLWYCHW